MDVGTDLRVLFEIVAERYVDVVSACAVKHSQIKKQLFVFFFVEECGTHWKSDQFHSLLPLLHVLVTCNVCAKDFLPIKLRRKCLLFRVKIKRNRVEIENSGRKSQDRGLEILPECILSIVFLLG